MDIVSREQWGARPWRGSVRRVGTAERRQVMFHYHGPKPRHQHGTAVPHDIESIHLANRWVGIGYNFVIDMDGRVYEGRGYDIQGAHCPGYNRSAWGVQIAVGMDQVPTQAAFRAAKELYDHLCQRAGYKLKAMGHRDGKSTSCPGEPIYQWLGEGMPLDEEAEEPKRRPRMKQAELLLAEDGVLGPKTISKMQSLFKTPTDGKLDGVGEFVLVGDHHNEGDPDNASPCTLRMQHRLNGDVGSQLVVDGYLGHKTAKALQRWLGVSVDGYVGKETVTALQHRLNKYGW